ncbi:hypothetical protein CXB51_027832 [Gossypium anomalum]|uniref:Large ribosomal subunit protein eL20 domain-containing protein n=1 Tax=Gossypium anomalum TaxID=47600 RepID=A0A8J5XX17_9ROSI|nr:hypothetical protein CXB51_027832 [Gossypium anomalum]
MSFQETEGVGEESPTITTSGFLSRQTSLGKEFSTTITLSGLKTESLKRTFFVIESSGRGSSSPLLSARKIFELQKPKTSNTTFCGLKWAKDFSSTPKSLNTLVSPQKANRERIRRFHQYQVVGRGLPTEADQHPKIYRMKLWATNEVRAKSKYFLRKLKKVKKSNGQVLAINEIFEKNPTKIKNYGIWLRYQSRTGYHNMYKEYRDTTLNGAVEQMYTEMASRHRVRFPCIQIIKTATIPAKLCKRDSTKQFHNSKIKFPLVFKKVRPPTRKLKTTYKASKPNLFM